MIQTLAGCLVLTGLEFRKALRELTFPMLVESLRESELPSGGDLTGCRHPKYLIPILVPAIKVRAQPQRRQPHDLITPRFAEYSKICEYITWNFNSNPKR